MTFSNGLTRDQLRQLVGLPLSGGWVSGASADTPGNSGLWLGLSTGEPGDNGLAITPPSTNDIPKNNYDRILVDALGWNQPTNAQPAVVTNNQTYNFPAATGGPWGTLHYLTLHSAQTGGNYLGAGAINGTAGITVNENDIPSFASGAASISLT
jgi:hypothetical protein